MYSRFKIIFVTSFLVNFVIASNLEHDGWVEIKLEHTLTPNVFTERGNVSIQSLRLGQSQVNQKVLTQEERTQLQELAAKNLFYQLRATVTPSTGVKSQFLSTIKACMLAEAELDDRLSVSLDYTGRVIGVTLVVASKSTCEGAAIPLDKLGQFTTTVYVRQTETGPIPDTTTYIQKMEREREAKERGEVKDNRSFLAKYWMYILPLLLLVMVSSMANPEAAAGAGGGGGGPAR